MVAVRHADRNTEEGTQQRVFTSYHNFPSAKAVDVWERVEYAAIVYDHPAMAYGVTLLGTRMDRRV